MGTRRLILTADDFGLAVPVNEAVEEAHRRGVLTAASLMVGAGATADAVARARQLPALRVGLHLVLVEGRPVLPPERVPDLVDSDGAFRTDLVKAGFAFFFLPGVRAQLAAEIRAQFAAFQATGLPLDHVNAHNHMHLHPTVSRLMLQVGEEFGLRGVRLPVEPPGASARAAGTRPWGRRLASAAWAPWFGLLRSRLRRAGVAHNDFVFGLNDSGRMEESLVLRQVDSLPRGVTEMYFHIATRGCPELENQMPDYRHQAELAALLSERVRARIRSRGIEATTFSDLPGTGA
ncbi:MAG: hopanoid biosynthesis-associated protein HpnK [Myxococcota bacterium]|nr:hopanoid biosynthesis-associated protein HpnK [Myxococcota bacterium]